MSGRLAFRYCLPLFLFAAACNDPGKAVDSVASALVHSNRGKLMVYGGGACIEVHGSQLDVLPCAAGDPPNQTFEIHGDKLKTSDGLCVDVRFGDLAAGVVGAVGCNSSVNQQWIFNGGKIISKNTTAGQSYCLDAHFFMARRLGLAPCNGNAEQVFWLAGFTQNIGSSFSVSTGPGTCAKECLDVLFDIEQVGTGLVNFNCNGSTAQWFTFDRNGLIRLANNPSLCVGIGPIQNEVAPVALQSCSLGVPTQRWRLSNLPTGTSIKNQAQDLCLDVTNANPTPSTPVVAVACNATAAQTWFPQLDVPTCP